MWHQAQGQIKQSRHLLDQILGLMGGRCPQCSPRLLSVWAKPVELLQDCLVWDCVPRLAWDGKQLFLPSVKLGGCLSPSQNDQSCSRKRREFSGPLVTCIITCPIEAVRISYMYSNTALVVVLVDLYKVWWACSYVIYIMCGVWLCCWSVVIVYKWTGWLQLTNSARASYGSIF